MKTYLLVDNKKIYYSDTGKGFTIVLLHGYLESSETFNDFSIDLSKKYRVISFDIPGHGESEILSEFHSMEVLAKVIFKSLRKLEVNKCFMVGHSMGGFLTLMFHKLYSELLSGFCLFHSHPFADTEATKKKRLREIEFVKNDQVAFEAGMSFNMGQLLSLPFIFAGIGIIIWTKARPSYFSLEKTG